MYRFIPYIVPIGYRVFKKEALLQKKILSAAFGRKDC
jgi:hypothetical protein